jgi:predicted N-acetyltransferase YhbS
MGWLFIEALWVAVAHRSQGHGRRIVQRAEQEARRRGAQGVYLNTFSFQAPDFYIKLGYRPCGRLDDIPAGHFRLYLAKSL